jgi:hypothetical protein
MAEDLRLVDGWVKENSWPQGVSGSHPSV